MPTGHGLTVRRKSATPSSGTNIRREAVEISKLVDIDLCIGCKACEIACKEWNDLAPDDTFNFGSYQSHEDLTANTWDLMRFKEVDLDNGDLAWLIRKDSCMHCDEPGCLLACPAPGAIVQYQNGIVDFDQTKCIGCQYCIAGCPFDIPRFDQETKKVYKCTMCVDRVGSGLEPACVKACPTGSIRFGSKQEMVDYGEAKVAKLRDRGFSDALLYDPAGVNGLHMMYVVPRGEMLDDYGLPSDPNVTSRFSFIGALHTLRAVGAVSIWAGLIASAAYWLRTGRLTPPPEPEAVHRAHHLAPAAPDAAPPPPPSPDAATSTTPATATEPDTEADAESATEPDTEVEAEVATEAETDTGAEVEAEPEPEPEPEAEAEAEARAETATEPDTEAEAAPTEPDTEAEAEVDTEADTEASTGTDTDTEADADTEAEAAPTEPDTEAEAESAAEAEAESAAEAEAETGAETPPEADTEPAGETQVEAEPEPGTDTETEPEEER